MRIQVANPASTFFEAVTSDVVTPAGTPTAGSLLIIISGGTQNRTITPPSGWTLHTRVSSSGTLGLMYKVATGSEPANYTVTFSAGLSGGSQYFELRNAETSSPIALTIGTQGASLTTISPGTYAVDTPGLAITFIAKSFTAAWTADNGFTNFPASGQMKVAVKNFQAIDTSETVNWSGTIEDVGTDLVFIKSRFIR